MILFHSDHLKIEFRNVPCRHLVTKWQGMPGSATYQDGMITILKCCHDNDVSKLLSDIRLQEMVSAEDKHFVEKAIQNHTSRHGVLYQAVILSSEVFTKFSSEQFDRSVAEKHFVQQFFSNEFDAVGWLREVDL
jgi:hypothetical protein